MTPEELLIEELSKKSPGAAALARVVSLAVLVEPQLLRRARIELLPGVDAGAEADLWLSPLVQTRGPRGITLLPRVAERLRHDLARDGGLFERATKLTDGMHSASPPTVRLEEKINLLYASRGRDALDDVEELLRSAVNTLVSYEERWGLAHWAAGALTRLPEEVRNLESARMLAAAAHLRLSSYLPADSVKAVGGVMPDWLSWVVPTGGGVEPEFSLGVQLVEGGVRLGGPAESGHTMLVPDTNPLLVELSWPEAEGAGRRVHQVRLDKGAQLRIATPHAAVRLRTMTGDCYELAPAATHEPAPAVRGVCYVSMPFGTKVDFRTGRKLNLDNTYENVIKPAVTGAGLECIRADEIVHSGVIDVPMYKQLLEADVVIADLSTSNPQVFYELGVRHALRPYTTIVISEDKADYPFDINKITVRKYRHLGEDIGFADAMRFRDELKRAIEEIYGREPRQNDSPVYAFLRGLTPPSIGDVTQGAPEPAAKTAPVSKGAKPRPEAGQPYAELMRRADEAQRHNDFATARKLLSQIHKTAGATVDPDVTRRLALATYKSKQPTPQIALEEARELLLTLNPATSNDTETLGMWGAVHKRLWDLTRERVHLDEAVRGYKRGFYLRNDYYNGINLAFLYNVRASALPDERAEAIADFVQAERIRREVLSICEEELAEGSLSDEQKYWVLSTMAEAHLGVGDEAAAEKRLKEAATVASADWMKETTKDQLDKLHALLKDSPLKYVKTDD